MEPVATIENEVKTILEGFLLKEAGENVLLATVVKTWGSSPRPVGAVMVLTESGIVVGSVSGGCIEDELVDRVKKSFPASMELVQYSSETSRTLPCGGTLLLVLEPLQSLHNPQGLINTLAKGERVTRTLQVEKGLSTWSPSKKDDKTYYEEQVVQVVYDKPWSILIIGMGELAQCVYRQALLLNYIIEVCEPREGYRNSWPFQKSNISKIYPDDFIKERQPDSHTAVVALTHDPKIDDMAIMEALESKAFYVGALGSTRTTKSRKDRLMQHFNFQEKTLERLHAPIGVDVNSRRPQEIALSILIEITAEKNNVAITSERL